MRDLPDNARFVWEQQFGPVIPVLASDTVDDVIARANDSKYGLGGTIWTDELDRGEAIAMKIQMGTVWVNQQICSPLDVPFGGAKQSGFRREHAVEGMKEFAPGKIFNVAKKSALEKAGLPGPTVRTMPFQPAETPSSGRARLSTVSYGVPAWSIRCMITRHLSFRS